MKLTYAILLPTLDRPELVKVFLGSVARQTRLPAEVVVIDQSDGSETERAFAEWAAPAGVRKTYLKRPVKSLILARNAGIDASGPVDLVAFFDDDVLLEPDVCEIMVSRFEADTAGRYGGGMATISGSQRRPRPIQALFFMPREGSGKFLASGAPTFPHWKKEFAETDFISGGITFWRKSVIAKYRFDERMWRFAYCDDVDVSYRVSREYKNFFEPRAVCHHKDHFPTGDRARRYRRGWVQNMHYLARKNGHSMLAYWWCVVGHFLRDLLMRDWPSLRGDWEAVGNILRGTVDTISEASEVPR